MVMQNLLMLYIYENKDKIFHKFNINLELEIKLVGFEQKILNELGYNES